MYANECDFAARELNLVKSQLKLARRKKKLGCFYCNKFVITEKRSLHFLMSSLGSEVTH